MKLSAPIALPSILILLCLSGAASAALPDAATVPRESELAQSARVARLLVEGMRTKRCPLLVRAALRKVEGVREVAADAETKIVRVTYDPSRVTPEQIRAAIKSKAGFDSRVLAN